MKDIGSLEQVIHLVDSFYKKVREDALLSPLVAHVDWPHHLPVMYNFWSSILLGDMSYNGSPLAKHLSLPLTRDHFNQWLKLFTETVDSEFAGPVADEAKNRASTVANLFQYKMGLMKT